MTARVVTFRPPNPTRRPVMTVAVAADLVEPWMEVVATGDAATDFANVALRIARQVQLALARGNVLAAATIADELEQIAPRVAQRARIASATAKAHLARLEGISCPDAVARPGHGKAA